MKLKALVAGMALVAMFQGAMAAEPTRGFAVEKGVTAAQGKASLDFTVEDGEEEVAARLGLGNAELLLSRGNVGYGFATGAVLKLAIKDVDGLAVYGGVAYFDGVSDDFDDSYLNLKVGAAYSIKAEQLELTFSPELVIDDLADDNYLNVGISAFLNLGKSAYGTFKPGLEVLATSADDADTVIALGVRWEYNDRFIIDAIPVLLGGEDTLAMPGMLRINLAF